MGDVLAIAVSIDYGGMDAQADLSAFSGSDLSFAVGLAAFVHQLGSHAHRHDKVEIVTEKNLAWLCGGGARVEGRLQRASKQRCQHQSD
jgi:hypothetical protein